MNKIVLAGNPNVGKSVFFRALTGVYAEVSNYPGTTVDITEGNYKGNKVTDTPGVYGISSFNDEERVARDVIVEADLIVNVVEGVHLQRDLFLTQQLLDMGKTIIVCVNMMDEVIKNGIRIDTSQLSLVLGVPVIPCTALKGEGLSELMKALDEYSTNPSIFKKKYSGNPVPKVSQLLAGEKYPRSAMNNAYRLLLLEDDEEYLKKFSRKRSGLREQIYRCRRDYIDSLLLEIVKEKESAAGISGTISKILLKPIIGELIFIGILAGIFAFVGIFVAQIVTNFTEKTIMQGMYEPFIQKLLVPLTGKNGFFYELFIGEFGLLTMLPIYVLGLLLPLVAGFYLMLSILEDTGYLPRAAVIMDRGLNKIGLNGRAVIPLVLGFGCVTVATVSTRILGSRRERFIATLLLGLTIPCSAQTGIIVAQLIPLGAGFIALYLVIIIGIFILAGKISNKLLKGESSPLLIDIPRMRLPSPRNIFTKTLSKSVAFLKEAVPIFALGSVIITLMNFTGILKNLIDLLSPVTQSFLGLPKESASFLIMGIVRRDFGAAGLNSLIEQGVMNNGQIFISLVVLTLFVPCIAAIMMIFKERGKRDAAIIWLGSMAIAFLIGGILNILL